jgi:hypothetical protein
MNAVPGSASPSPDLIAATTVAPGEPQPVGQRRAGQVRVIDHDHQRRALGQPPERADQGGVEHAGPEHAVGQQRRGPRGPRGPAGRPRLRAGREVQRRDQQGRVGAEDGGAFVGTELTQPGRGRGQQRVERQRPVERPARRHQHRVPVRPAPAGPGPQQRRLPDAGLAVDHDHLGLTTADPGRDRLEAGQLVVPADQDGTETGAARPGRLAAQDRGVERGRLRRGVGAQFVGHPGPRAGVGGQRRGHPAARHVAAQQHPQGRLVVRVAFDRRRRGVAGRHPVPGAE